MAKRSTAFDMIPGKDKAAVCAWLKRWKPRGGSPSAALAGADVKESGHRSKFGAQEGYADGFRFDSHLEMNRYLFLLRQPYVSHVDVHPIVTIDAGKVGRVTMDFGVYIEPEYCAEGYGCGQAMHYEDVKGWHWLDGKAKRRCRRTEFMRMWQRFDNAHPAAPLWIVSRSPGMKSGWIVKRRDESDAVDTDMAEGSGAWR